MNYSQRGATQYVCFIYPARCVIPTLTLNCLHITNSVQIVLIGVSCFVSLVLQKNCQ